MRWPWNRRRRRALDDSLREFVYLDEVSVYSLLASREDGFIELDRTLTESVTRSRGIVGRIGVGGGMAGSELRSHLESSNSAGSQVVKKSIIQTAFKQLLEREADRLVVADSWRSVTLPKVGDGRALQRACTTGHVIPLESLRRGSLLELEVELDTERIFQASRLVTTLWEFFERIPELFPLDNSSRSAGLQIQELFGQLLHDLVPIEARIVNYGLVEGEWGSFLVSRQLLESENWKVGARERDVYLVGVAEEKLFWRDLRRVLFSRSRYHVMARIGRDGIQEKWQPVKIAEMLGRVIPQIDDQMRELGESFLSGVKEGAGEIDQGSGRCQNDALAKFASVLAQANDLTWEDSDSVAVGLCDALDPDPGDLPQLREACKPLVAHLEAKLGSKIDSEMVSDARSLAFLEHTTDGSALSPPMRRAATEPSFVDCEIVAIYW